MSATVREPIQVYLTSDERQTLDLAARKFGVSRSEVLRRGLRAVSGSSFEAGLGTLAAEGALTPARAGPGTPPPSRPVAPLRELLAELARDRAER